MAKSYPTRGCSLYSVFLRPGPLFADRNGLGELASTDERKPVLTNLYPSLPNLYTVGREKMFRSEGTSEKRLLDESAYWRHARNER